HDQLILGCILCLAGHIAVLITQWPKDIISPSGASVDMHCYQNDTDYDYLYWYRQLKGKEPALIGRFVAGSATYEKGFESGFSISSTKKKKWSLNVAIKEDSNAVFFCAYFKSIHLLNIGYIIKSNNSCLITKRVTLYFKEHKIVTY
uniref:Immunoglobulin V-set domain-containing protein n=1 Tax=Astyanax mexicanus TaxID=7994 RepID=A0A3B1J5T7_ASTMX